MRNNAITENFARAAAVAERTARLISRYCLLTCAFAVATGGALLNGAESNEAVVAGAAGALTTGSDRQLFLDDRLVDLDRTRDVTRTMNPPQDIRRVLAPDQPWETLGFIFYASVIDAGEAIQLFYGSYSYDEKMVRHFCLATSRDGLNWIRPNLGLKAFNGSKDNNMVSGGSFDGAVFLDPHAPPEKRYRLLASSGMDTPDTGGLFVESSPDGIHWTRSPARVLPFVPDSQHAAFWDARLNQYVAYVRSWRVSPRMRQVSRVQVADLEKPWPYQEGIPPLYAWGKEKTPTPSSELPVVLANDEKDPENLDIYTSTAQLYPFAPNTYLAFPATYFKYKGPEWKDRAVSGNDGVFEPQLATSSDGLSWSRWRQPYVAPGFYEGVNLRLVSMAHGLVRRGRWIYQYFVGWPHTHGRPDVWNQHPENAIEWTKEERGGIYCARQRLDGFVSMDGAYTGGVLTTRPLAFKGNRLLLNIDTQGSGSARVALLEADGAEVRGFTAAACQIISADETDQVVCWKDGADVSALAGRPIRVQITMRNTKLYAIQFATKPAARRSREKTIE